MSGLSRGRSVYVGQLVDVGIGSVCCGNCPQPRGPMQLARLTDPMRADELRRGAGLE